MPQPLTSQSLFNRNVPLEIEIGSGKGLFLQNASRALPGHVFLGIEVAGKYAKLAAYRLARDRVPNARVLHGDAARILRDYLPDDGLAAVHIYFPDPWWKKRHHRRRIMNAAVLHDIERALAPGGAFHFWTDVRDYFDASLGLIEQCTQLEGPFDVPIEIALHDLDYRTHFERRVRLNDLPVYRAEYRKPAWRIQQDTINHDSQ